MSDFQRPPTTMQTLILSKDKFKTAESAQKWAKDQDFKSGKVDETEKSFRLRQRDPGEFQDGSFRTIDITDGVKGVIGRLKETKAWMDIPAVQRIYSDNPELSLKEFSDVETYEITGVDIFAVGKWNGDKYTVKDLDTLVDNFKKTKKDLKPYLKLGHGSKQKLLREDELPAAGLIDNLRRIGHKLVADFINMPKKVYQLIKRGAYSRVSSEIYPSVKINGEKFGLSLKAVAILGGETPAVSTLDDILTLYASCGEARVYEQGLKYKIYEVDMSKFDELHFGQFGAAIRKMREGKEMTIAELAAKVGVDPSTIAGIETGDIERPPDSRLRSIASALGTSLEALKRLLPSAKREEKDMTKDEQRIEELEADLEKANSKVAEFLQDKPEEDKKRLQDMIDDLKKRMAALKLEKEEMSVELEKLKKENKTSTDKLVKAAKEKKNAEVTATVEKLITDKKLAPANKEKVHSLLMTLSDGEVKKFSYGDEESTPAEAIIKLFEEGSDIDINTEEESGAGKRQKTSDNSDLADKAKKYAAEHKVSDRDALMAVAE